MRKGVDIFSDAFTQELPIEEVMGRVELPQGVEMKSAEGRN